MFLVFIIAFLTTTATAEDSLNMDPSLNLCVDRQFWNPITLLDCQSGCYPFIEDKQDPSDGYSYNTEFVGYFHKHRTCQCVGTPYDVLTICDKTDMTFEGVVFWFIVYIIVVIILLTEVPRLFRYLFRKIKQRRNKYSQEGTELTESTPILENVSVD